MTFTGGCLPPASAEPIPEAAPLPSSCPVIDGGRNLLARVEGPLDTARAPDFLARFRSAADDCSSLVLDLRRTEYVDSDGVRALLALQDELRNRQAELRLVVAPGSRVARTLTLLQLQERLNVCESMARAWFAGSQPFGRG